MMIIKRPKPTFFADHHRELEEKAERLSTACDLARLTIREAKGNMTCPEVKAEMVKELLAAVSNIRARHDELAEALPVDAVVA